MATEVIPMSVKATAAAYALDEQARAAINVTAVCRDEAVSRSVFYKYVDRVRREGLDGLEERSRRPRTSPQQTSVEVEDRVVRLRKELDDAGLDHGATSIQWHLGRQGHQGIGRQIPIDRWRASPVAGPAEQALAHPDWSSKNLQLTVSDTGCVRADHFAIHVGIEHQHRHALVVIDKTRANVFIGGELVQHLTLDHTRAYQPSGRKRGGPRKPRLPS